MTEPLVELSNPGDIMTAQLAPAKGPIPVAPGTPVVVVVQSFWASPTIKALRGIVVASWLAFLGYALGKIVEAHGLDGIDWHSVIHVGLNVGVLNGALGISALLRVHDNNPVNGGSR